MVRECGKKGAVSDRRQRRQKPPLDEAALRELALAYVGRFATTRSKLAQYLARKLRQRGWAGSGEAPVDRIVELCAASGYVDDAAFALAKARSLSGRGYGVTRVRQSLRIAGVSEDDSAVARALADEEAVEAALRFARRRRIGPFAERQADGAGRERALAAMIRAGHRFGLARSIIDLEPGSTVDVRELKDCFGGDPM